MRRSVLFAVLAGLVVAVLAACPWIRAAVTLADLAGVVDFRTVPRQALTYEGAGETRGGDLYKASRSGTGLVLVPGAAPAGKDDPRMIRLASALARAGFDVLVPDIPSERRFHLGPEDTAFVAAAVHRLAADERRVGIAAISYGVGPAILAALSAGPSVGFVVAIGGYCDLDAVIGFVTTGWYDEDGQWIRHTPNAYGRWAFALANAARLPDPSDGLVLRLMAERRMADRTAPMSDLEPRLTSDGRAVLNLLNNGDPMRVPALIEALPAPIRGDIRALDLARRDLGALKIPLILVHGRDDPVIPSGESRKLAMRVPGARLFLVDDLGHTDWRRHSVGGSWSLLRAVHALLEQRVASDR